MKRWIIIGMLVIGLVTVLLYGGLHLWTSLNESMSQDYLSRAITMAVYFEPWQGGAGQLSDDRVGSLVSKLDYSRYGYGDMRRNIYGFPLDVWGRPFEIHAVPAQDEVGVYVLEVRSAGPDGVIGSTDDVVHKEHIPVVFYVFRDRSDPGVAYDFAFIGARIVAQKVSSEKGGQVVLYEYYNSTGQLAKVAEKWKVEPGEGVAAGTLEEGSLTRVSIPADETESVQETCFPNRTQEYKNFLASLREQCMQESRRCRMARFPSFVVRDARLTRFLKANWPATSSSSGDAIHHS